MNAINGLLRLNVPENVNRSTPNGLDIQDHKINQPKQELDKITGRQSVGKGRELTIKEILILELFA
jgi:hypothetical protein